MREEYQAMVLWSWLDGETYTLKPVGDSPMICALASVYPDVVAAAGVANATPVISKPPMAVATPRPRAGTRSVRGRPDGHQGR